MDFIADFHIHSHYSRATSKEMNLVSLYKWGQIKGIQVIGTGDFTHPAWFNEIREKLEEAEPGLFTLKKELETEISKEIPPSCRTKEGMRFLLTVEISCIYSKGGKVRKVHMILAAPSFSAAAKINEALSKVGNLAADGRPILGLDAKELVRIALAASSDCMIIPAHAWTPHFGVLGHSSGFNSLEECFEEFTPNITAIETGLSSDPAMNWRLSKLDNVTLVSNSDAHSPGKLGREANRFSCELSYFEIVDALKKGDPKRFKETVEFYPEEGKYHLDGHMNCNVSLLPEETQKLNGICPKCSKKLIIGVMNRVETLADRPDQHLQPNEQNQIQPKNFEPNASSQDLLTNTKSVQNQPPNIVQSESTNQSTPSTFWSNTPRTAKRIPFRYLVPLPEILADILETGTTSQKVSRQYMELIAKIGNEFHILLDASIEDIKKASSPLIAEAIQRVRTGKIHIEPGYDGKFGVIKVFSDGQKPQMEDQMALF